MSKAKTKPPIPLPTGVPKKGIATDVPQHLTYLTQLSRSLTTAKGRSISVWKLNVSAQDPSLSEWARQFRQQYCPDNEIEELRQGTGLSRKEFLEQLIFPDRSDPPGPSIRSGDFAELLVSDYVEHILKFWVPRGKYAEKASRNESVKGVDILGFKMASSPQTPSANDTLVAFEVKGECSNSPYGGGLQKAIDDSAKDYLRSAITLNATKRRLLRSGDREKANIVERFQNKSDRPYIFRSGAAAVLSEVAYDPKSLRKNTVCSKHENTDQLELLVIRGKDLMKLVHQIYELAANEA